MPATSGAYRARHRQNGAMTAPGRTPLTPAYLAAPLAVLASFIHVAAAAQPAKQPRLRVLGTHESGIFNQGGAEIPTYDPITRRSFVVNAGSATVDVLDIRNPSNPSKLGSLDIVADLAPRSVGAANSVDARFGILAVAVEAEPKQDDGWVLEPEYITTDGETAWVTLQENNAIAVIDISTGLVRRVFALGFKDHSRAANRLDVSDADGAIRIRRWPVFGMYQPDAIANFRSGERQYLITVNEGDARDYDAFSEEGRVADLPLDPVAFPTAAELQQDENLGRLTVTTTLGDTDSDGDFDQLYVPGGRSFSIWNAKNGALVFDSGADLEQLLANLLPREFNANHEENDSLDNRSDNKGPEPEGVTLGRVRGKLYAFIGMERIGGILVVDLSDPRNSEYVDYLNNRRFRGAAGEPVPTCAMFNPPASDDIEDCVKPNAAAGDLGPEGLKFVPARDAPRGQPLLIVGNEVSGTTTVFEFR
jgi:hypothetical protein